MQKNVSLLNLIDEDFRKRNNIVHAYKGEKLYSKKNDVYKIKIIFKDKIEKTFVLKQYTGENKYLKIKNEIFFYTISGNTSLKIPGIFYKGSDFIMMQYLGDNNLLDYIVLKEQLYKEQDKKLDEADIFKKDYSVLADSLFYIFNFNNILKRITGKSYVLKDLNLRNFIVKDCTVYRVDFEDCGEGEVEEDFGRFIAFFITYDPSLTDWKVNISGLVKKICVSKMNLDLKKIEIEMEKELESMRNRRKLP